MQIVGWSHALEQGGKLALDQSVGYELSLRSSVGSRSRRVVSVATSCVTLTLARSRRLQRAFPDEARNGLSIEVFWYSILKSIATKSIRIAKNASVHPLSPIDKHTKTPQDIPSIIPNNKLHVPRSALASNSQSTDTVVFIFRRSFSLIPSSTRGPGLNSEDTIFFRPRYTHSSSSKRLIRSNLFSLPLRLRERRRRSSRVALSKP